MTVFMLRGWQDVDIFARHQLPALLKTVQSLQDVLQCTVTHAPMAQLEKFMAVRRLAAEDGDDTRGCCTAQTCYPSQNAAQVGLTQTVPKACGIKCMGRALGIGVRWLCNDHI